MNFKILFSALFLAMFLLSTAGAIVIYADSNQDSEVTLGDSISFDVDFFSMNPPMTVKIRLYYEGDLISNILPSTNTNSKTYSYADSYTPANTGTYKIIATGTDKISTDSHELEFTVTNPPINHAPVAQNQNVMTNQNTPKIITLSATDPDSDSFIYLINSIPSHGVLSSVSPTGQVTYTPNSGFSGFDSFTFKANDGLVDSNIATVSIIINSITPDNHAPEITSSPVTSVTEGNYYIYDIDAEDDDGDYLTYSYSKLPSWLYMHPATGKITGTAPLVSSSTDYTVEIEVSDGNGGFDTQKYTIRVKNRSSGSASGGRVISEPDIYYPNKYFDQYNPDVVIYSKPTTNKVFGLDVLVFFYILIALISTGIIIIVFLLGRNFRR